MNSTSLNNYLVFNLLADSHASSKLQELEMLIGHSDEKIRVRVAEQPYLSIKHLFALAGDSSSAVRVAIADNPSTPLLILQLLTLDDDPDVRYAIAENANLPVEILSILLQDENPYVAARACRTLNNLGRTRASSGSVQLLNRCA